MLSNDKYKTISLVKSISYWFAYAHPLRQISQLTYRKINPCHTKMSTGYIYSIFFIDMKSEPISRSGWLATLVTTSSEKEWWPNVGSPSGYAGINQHESQSINQSVYPLEKCSNPLTCSRKEIIAGIKLQGRIRMFGTRLAGHDPIR